MSDHNFAPPPLPDPATVTLWTQWFGQARSFAILLGGIGLGGTWLGTWLTKFTNLSDADLSGYAAALVTVLSIGAYLGPAVWSWIEKKRTDWAVARALRLATVAAAVASAQATIQAGRLMPVTVTVTPPGHPNEAVLVSLAEQAAAPAVPVNAPPSPAPPAPAQEDADLVDLKEGQKS